ncbi:MAG: hypothetical protein WD825_07355 [Gemmatimonadaceae bacterium]
MRLVTHPATRTLFVGTLLGVLILGVGGRIAMAMITASAGGAPRFTLGGTMTVVALGGASGFAGAVIALTCQFATRRLVPALQWVQHVLLAVMLLLVTMRGLRGTPAGAHWYFYALVAVYGVALVLVAKERSTSARR